MRFSFAATAAAATALLLACLGDVNAQGCPSFATKASIRKTVNGGKTAVLTVRIHNTGASAVNNAGLGLQLPNGATVKSVRVSPTLASVPVLEQDGDVVGWSGIPIAARKTRTFKIKLAFDQCAGGNPVPPKHANGKATGLYNGTFIAATFTGPIDDPGCVAYKAVTTNVRRPKSASGCAPPPPPPPSAPLCSIPIPGGSVNGKEIYGCGLNAPDGPPTPNWTVCGPSMSDFPDESLESCFNLCTQLPGNMVALTYREEDMYCKCFDSLTFPAAFRLGSRGEVVYSIGGMADPPVPTVQC